MIKKTLYPMKEKEEVGYVQKEENYIEKRKTIHLTFKIKISKNSGSLHHIPLYSYKKIVWIMMQHEKDSVKIDLLKEMIIIHRYFISKLTQYQYTDTK